MITRTSLRLLLAAATLATTALAALPTLPSERTPTFETGRSPTRVLHVAITGNDSTGDGSTARPLRTIGRGAAAAAPGTSIIVHSGTYPGGTYISNLAGTATAPIWIGGAPGEPRPVISGSAEGIHLTAVRYLILHNLEITASTDNGLNCDDGGAYANPEATQHLVLRDLRIHHVGTGGNQDGMKLSGVNDYFVLGCEITDGSAGGSGIDHVGCHRGLLVGNRFVRAGTNAVQTKGGSTDIEIRGNWVEECGSRGLHIGGSTGFAYFREPLSTTATNYEARRIRAIANVIIGAESAAGIVGASDCLVLNNTILTPHNWIFRILQETVTTPPYTFAACGNNTVANNLFYYDRADLSSFVNVGANTAPATFTFSHNLWYNYPNPAQSAPSLPVAETGGIIGQNPLLADVASGDLRLLPGSPALRAGNAYPELILDYQGLPYGPTPAIGAFASDTATYAAWRSASFAGSDLANDSISGPLADPGGAGVTNFQRYAFALAARGPVAAPGTLGTVSTGGQTYLTLSFNRRAVATDLSYSIEASTDLVTWTPVPGLTYTAGTPARVTAQDTVAVGSSGAARRFLRVRVSQP